eukprot:3335903-Pleurochrysis_carterae.AAC.1
MIKESTAPWKDAAYKIHTERWEYLHFPFHAAGYALDPEFLDTDGDTDKFTQDGLITVVERKCLADVLLESSDAKERLRTVSVNDADVQERVAVAMDEYSRSCARDCIFTKPFVLANAKTMPPAHWWASYGKHLPVIATVVQRVLSQPVSGSRRRRRSTTGPSTARSSQTCATALATRLRTSWFIAKRPSTSATSCRRRAT